METAYANICDQFNQAAEFDTDKKLNKELFYGNTSFAGLTRTGVIKRGSTTKRLMEEIKNGVKISLDVEYEQNLPIHYKHIMEGLAWFNIAEISAQFLQALPNQEGTYLNHLQMGTNSLEGMVKR